jgi:hypothetical protein
MAVIQELAAGHTHTRLALFSPDIYTKNNNCMRRAA